MRADVADEHAVAAMFEAGEDQFGAIDVVVNSAGRMTLSTIADLDLDALDAMHRTNIRRAFVVAREAASRLRDGGAFVTPPISSWPAKPSRLSINSRSSARSNVWASPWTSRKSWRFSPAQRGIGSTVKSSKTTPE